MNIRAADVYRAPLGLPHNANLPTPVSAMRLIQSRPGFLEASAEGTLRQWFDPLVDRRFFASLQNSSRVSYVSGVHFWIRFTETMSISPAKQLGISEADAARWLSLMRTKATALSYRSHLKYAWQI